MAKLLLYLRHVPPDEIEEIEAMLDRHGIEHYRTPASIWGINAGGLWVADSARHADAKAHMAVYQAERLQRSRAEFEQARQEGRAPGFLDTVRSDPVRVALVLFGIAVVFGISTIPFLLLMR
jgi:hypothetical protein